MFAKKKKSREKGFWKLYRTSENIPWALPCAYHSLWWLLERPRAKDSSLYALFKEALELKTRQTNYK